MVKLTQTIGLQMLRPAIGTDQQGTINADFEEIQFDKVAEAMGCHGERVADPKPISSRRSGAASIRADRRSSTSTSIRTCICSRQGFRSSRRCTRSRAPDGQWPRGPRDRGGRIRRSPLCRRPRRAARRALGTRRFGLESSPPSDARGSSMNSGDICDPDLRETFRKHGIDTVVHLASIVRAPKGAPEDLAYQGRRARHEKRPRSLRSGRCHAADRDVERRCLRIPSATTPTGWTKRTRSGATTSSSTPSTNASSRKCCPNGGNEGQSFVSSCFDRARSSAKTYTVP